MKTIDWKNVSSNPAVSKQFSIEVFNRFEALCDTEINSDNIDEMYGNLIKTTEEVALSSLPRKKSKSKNKPSKWKINVSESK